MISLFLALSLSGCATDKIVTVYKTVTVYQDRYIEIPEALTQPVEIVQPPDGDIDTIDLRVMYLAQKTRARQCNGQLAEIANIKDTSHD